MAKIFAALLIFGVIVVISAGRSSGPVNGTIPDYGKKEEPVTKCGQVDSSQWHLLERCQSLPIPKKPLPEYCRDVESTSWAFLSPCAEFAAPLPSKWEKSATTSPIDDTKSVTLSVESLSSVGSGWNKGMARLVLRCEEKKTDVILSYPMFLTTQDVRIRYRVDEKKAVTASFSPSSDFKAAFSRSPIPFIRSLLNNNLLYVEVVPHGENPVSATFPISGLVEPLKELQEACRWK